MAYTTELALANDAYERLKILDPQYPASAIPRLVTMIPAALTLLGERVRDTNPEGMQRAFSITITSGAAALSSLTGVLFDPDISIVFPPSSTVPAEYLEPEEFENNQLSTGASEATYYTQHGLTLRFRNPVDGATNTLSGTGSITANYVPSLTDADRPVPTQYEPALVSTLVQLALADPVLKRVEASELAAVGRA